MPTFSKAFFSGQSMTAGLLFTRGLAAKFADATGQAFPVHPGLVATPRAMQFFASPAMANAGYFHPDGKPVNPKLWKVIEAAAATHVFAAFEPSIATSSGSFLDNCGIHDDRIFPYASSAANTERLWRLSEQLRASLSRTSLFEEASSMSRSPSTCITKA
jgi:hypothetical protein